MVKAALIVVSLLLVLVTTALIRVENERYALSIGMCWDKQLGVGDWRCLQSVQTRTGWVWHVFYAVAD